MSPDNSSHAQPCPCAWCKVDQQNTETPCAFCGHPFDQDGLGLYGCPDCHGDGTGEVSTKPRPQRVVMFRPEFEEPILAGTKVHTLRPPFKRPINPAALLSLRVWTGLPYRTPQREFLRVPLLRIEPVEIGHHSAVVSGELLTGERLERFARADGFESWPAMAAAFGRHYPKEPRPLTMVMLRWAETPTDTQGQ